MYVPLLLYQDEYGRQTMQRMFTKMCWVVNRRTEACEVDTNKETIAWRQRHCQHS
jgi:hypothetical protein